MQAIEAARAWGQLLALYGREQRRSRAWTARYRAYLGGLARRPPYPTVLMIVPTEACNLRCRMCNQWGDSGYLRAGLRPVGHAEIGRLLDFLDRFARGCPDFLLMIHGGEPLLYQHLERLLEHVASRGIDTYISTNGTRLARHARQLSAISAHCCLQLSVDGDERAHDRVRGEGALRQVLDNTAALRARALATRAGLPKYVINCCLSEHNPDGLRGLRPLARRIGAQVINVELREYAPAERGEAFAALLRRRFGLEPRGAWRGYASAGDLAALGPAVDALYALLRRQRLLPAPPLLTVIPDGLTHEQARAFFSTHDGTFGIGACLMPSYCVRIQSNGDLLPCSSQPDIVSGNVFEQDFDRLYFEGLHHRVRRYLEQRLFPVCNRCCGLFAPKYVARRLGGRFRPRG